MPRRAPAMPHPILVLFGAFLAFAVGVAFIASSDDWADRSNWSELACLASYEENYEYRDTRPVPQGGRGGTLMGRRTVCTERATIGPVMPRYWRPPFKG